MEQDEWEQVSHNQIWRQSELVEREEDKTGVMLWMNQIISWLAEDSKILHLPFLSLYIPVEKAGEKKSPMKIKKGGGVSVS